MPTWSPARFGRELLRRQLRIDRRRTRAGRSEGRARLQLVIFLVLCLLLGGKARATVQQAPEYERRELTIPVRDGTTLFAVALLPKNAASPLPILLIRTPFGAAGEFRSAELPAQYRELGEDGYIFVVEDIRGRFGSGGEFVSLRPQRDPADPRGTDESTDAYDSIDWLVKNLPGNSGKVGVLGISYRGWLAGLAGVAPHPALKAISPQAPVTDVWMGDDFFHQGAFRQSQGLEYTAFMERDPKGFSDLPMPEYDHFDFYHKYPTLDSLARATDVLKLPSWTGFSTHPAYDRYWRERAMQNVLTRPEVPILFVGGFWDQEDLLGPELAYRSWRRPMRRGGITSCSAPGSTVAGLSRQAIRWVLYLWEATPPSISGRRSSGRQICGARKNELGRAGPHGQLRRVHLRSGASSSLSPSPRPRQRLAHLAGTGPALRGRSSRCADLEVGAARR